MALIEISRTRFKQSKNSLLKNINLCYGNFCKFLGDFREKIVFLEGLVKFREIRNIEDLVKF